MDILAFIFLLLSIVVVVSIPFALYESGKQKQIYDDIIRRAKNDYDTHNINMYSYNNIINYKQYIDNRLLEDKKIKDAWLSYNEKQ